MVKLEVAVLALLLVFTADADDGDRDGRSGDGDGWGGDDGGRWGSGDGDGSRSGDGEGDKDGWKEGSGGSSVQKTAYYQFSQSYDQAFNDFTGNGNYAINGGTLKPESSDVCCTGSGAYFDSTLSKANYIDLPSNLYKSSNIFGSSNVFAVACWVFPSTSNFAVMEIQDGYQHKMLKWEVASSRLMATMIVGSNTPYPTVSLSDAMSGPSWYFIGMKVDTSYGLKVDLFQMAKGDIIVKTASKLTYSWSGSKKYVFFGVRTAPSSPAGGTAGSWYLFEAQILNTLDNDLFSSASKLATLPSALSPACQTPCTGCTQGACLAGPVCLFGKVKNINVATGCDFSCGGCFGDLCNGCASPLMIPTPSLETCECLPGYHSATCIGILHAACSYPCNTCSSSTNCLTCSDPKATVNGSGNCVCKDGYVANAAGLCIGEK